MCRNARSEYDKVYHTIPENKNKRYSTKKANICKELKWKAKDAENGFDYKPSVYVKEILEMDGIVEDDVECKETNNVAEEQMDGPSVDVEALATASNHKKPSIPQSQQKCNDCPLFGHKTMRSAMCKEHHRYLQLQQ